MNGLNVGEKYFNSKQCPVFISFSSSHVRLLLKVGALSINAVKDCFSFRKRAATRVGAPSIKRKRILCFSKEHRGANFCPSYLEGGVLLSVYGIDSICRFYYICDQFLLHLWSIVTFAASTAI